MDKSYKHATELENRLRRAMDAPVVPDDTVPAPGQVDVSRLPVDDWCAELPSFCFKCGEPFDAESTAHAWPVDGPGCELNTAWTCHDCAEMIERRSSIDPVESFNPKTWAVLCLTAVVIIITLNVI